MYVQIKHYHHQQQQQQQQQRENELSSVLHMLV